MDTRELKNWARALQAEEAESLLQKAIEKLQEEREKGGYPGEFTVKGGLVELLPEGKVVVVGDIHGDLESLCTILEKSSFLKRVEKEKIQLVFLGDYGDRGEETCEVWWTVLKLKLIFPEKVITLRGNHEPPQGLGVYPFDLPYFLMARYADKGKKLYDFFPTLFNLLPHTLIVKGKYLMLHGGLPEKITSIEDIEKACDTHPATSYLEEILWSDPGEGEGCFSSPRGAGKIFGEDVSEKILNLLGVRTLIRSHEPCEGTMVLHKGRVLTLFSRKGEPYYNKKAAFLEIDLSASVRDAKDLSEEMAHYF